MPSASTCSLLDHEKNHDHHHSRHQHRNNNNNNSKVDDVSLDMITTEDGETPLPTTEEEEITLPDHGDDDEKRKKKKKSAPLRTSDYIGFGILAISFFIVGGCFTSTLWSTISLIVASQAKKGGLQPIDIAFSVIYYACVFVMFFVGFTGAVSSLVRNRRQRFFWSGVAIFALLLYATLQAASTVSSLVFAIMGLATGTSKNMGYDIFIVIYYSGSLLFTMGVAALCLALHLVRLVFWIREYRVDDLSVVALDTPTSASTTTSCAVESMT